MVQSIFCPPPPFRLRSFYISLYPPLDVLPFGARLWIQKSSSSTVLNITFTEGVKKLKEIFAAVDLCVTDRIQLKHVKVVFEYDHVKNIVNGRLKNLVQNQIYLLCFFRRHLQLLS